MTTAPKKILVLGAGFGGLTFCQTFRHADASVTVVDAQNHHLLFPIGFDNKLTVLIQWACSYCTDKRGARIIIGDAAGWSPDAARVIPIHNSEAPREPQLAAPARDMRQSA